MKATGLTTAAVLLALISFNDSAFANHRTWRVLDDLAYDALGHARDARWEIHDHFVASRDYEELLDDAHALTSALRAIQDAIEEERNPRAIRRLVDETHDILMHLEEHAERCEYGRMVPGTVSYNNGRFRYRPEIRHAGYVHVRALKEHIRLVDDILHELEEELILMRRGRRHDHDIHDDRAPRVPYFDDSTAPGPALPPRPTILPYESSAESHDVSRPLVGSRTNDFWLRLLLN